MTTTIDYNRNRSLKQHAYDVRVSIRFVALTLLSSSLLAVVIGQVAFVFIDQGWREQIWHDRLGRNQGTAELPTLALHDGNHAPNTEDTATVLDTVRSDISSRWIVTEAGQDRCWSGEQGSCRADIPPSTSGEESKGVEHLPQGQHLLMDIQRVDSQFLNSEQRLTKAMFDLVDECGLTLLSHHCHGLARSGFSCAGILLESHVSLHTWPAEGVISLDLFTCGDESLLPMVPLAEKLFSIPPPNSHVKPRIIWAHKIRGFFDDVLSGESEMTDLFNFPIGMMTDFKREVRLGIVIVKFVRETDRLTHFWIFSSCQVVSEETAFQRVDIYDVLLPRFQNLPDYEESLGTDDSYQATHPELFKPDRIVFLDGVMQSRGSGDAAYHEALVHPAMFAHPNPKRVAIIGGGEGATLREVLKHKTVEKVVMIDIDQGVVDLSRKYLPGWSDCSMLEGSASNCFDDPRTELFCEDAFQWFIERYGGDEMMEEPFDVIIMDAL
jgi:spermidine synthase